VNDRVTFGVAAVPQLMSAARWQYVDTPGGVGNVSYGAMKHNSEILAMRFAGGVGIRVNRKVSVGATFGAVYNANTLETAYVFQNHPALAGLKTGLQLTTTGIGWNGTAGITVKPTSNWEFGAAYKSKTEIVSNGSANGNIGTQLAAIGLGGARPDFRYDARVDNYLPQSLLGYVSWRVKPTLRLTAQSDWVNWRRAFTSLPVTLTNGNNADINGVLGTNGIKDSIPLNWKNQAIGRLGIEKQWKEHAAFRGGYAYASNPVPSSTLSPLTAAITQHTATAGFGYQFSSSRFDVSYNVDPTMRQSVGQSSLKSGEYSNSRTGVRVQALLFSWSVALP
jgi:long-subunit fatty acid transport protein